MDKKSRNVVITSTITSKNQVTIPKAVREILKVKPSDEIEWHLGSAGQVIVKKHSPNESDVWTTVDEQEQKYGSVDTPEVDWGPDVGLEDFD